MAERFEGQSELRRLRKERGISQDRLVQLMAAAGVPVRQATISTWETEDGRRPTSAKIRTALHKLLGVRPDLWFTAEELEELDRVAKLRRLPAQG